MERYITRTIKNTNIEFIMTSGFWNEDVKAYEAGSLRNDILNVDVVGEVKDLDEALKVLEKFYKKGAQFEDNEIVAVTPIKLIVTSEKYRMLEIDFIRLGEKVE